MLWRGREVFGNTRHCILPLAHSYSVALLSLSLCVFFTHSCYLPWSLFHKIPLFISSSFKISLLTSLAITLSLFLSLFSYSFSPPTFSPPTFYFYSSHFPLLFLALSFMLSFSRALAFILSNPFFSFLSYLCFFICLLLHFIFFDLSFLILYFPFLFYSPFSLSLSLCFSLYLFSFLNWCFSLAFSLAMFFSRDLYLTSSCLFLIHFLCPCFSRPLLLSALSPFYPTPVPSFASFSLIGAIYLPFFFVFFCVFLSFYFYLSLSLPLLCSSLFLFLFLLHCFLFFFHSFFLSFSFMFLLLFFVCFTPLLISVPGLRLSLALSYLFLPTFLSLYVLLLLPGHFNAAVVASCGQFSQREQWRSTRKKGLLYDCG